MLVLPGLLLSSGCYDGLALDDGLGGSSDGRLPGASDGSGDSDGDGDGGGDGDSDALCGTPQVGMTDLRRLTGEQYDNTIRDLLGLDVQLSADFSPDERIGPFKSNAAAPVGELQVEQYMSAAETVAELAVTDLSGLLPCDPTVLGEDACAEAFLQEFAPRALRRPLSPGHLERLMGVYLDGKAEGDFQNGIRVAIAGILQSPYFLYHIESGTPTEDGGSEDGATVPLDDYELASRLSYFLWNTMPDDELFAAAQGGELETDDGLQAQVDRMLADPRAVDTIATFHTQWLGVDELDSLEKDGTVFPAFSPELAAAMKAETADFARYVLLEGDGKLETLLTANFTVTDDPELLDLYGVELPDGYQPGEPVPLPAGERSGLLTQAGILAEHSHANQTSPIHRGQMVRENLFCQMLPPPPPDVDNVPPDPDPNATTRERFAQHTSDPSCAGCHVLIDPIGFGLENYDGIGAFRTVEGDLPVDASGELVGTDVDGPFDGGVELVSLIAQSDLVRQCVSRQWFRYALGRNETDEDECSTSVLDEAFAASDYDVRELLRTLVLTDAFRHRRALAAGTPPEDN